MVAEAWTGLSAGLSVGVLALVFGAFVLGGVVKGTLGIGLPLVAVPLLSLGLPATRAIVLVMMPVLVSNGFQAWDSGISAAGVRRFLPLMAALLVCTLLTVPLTLALPEATLRNVLAGLVLMAVTLNALPLRLNVSPRHERLWSTGIGAVSGVMGGMSSLTGPVIISYLMSLRLPREVFVGTISVIYLSGSIPLYASMAARGRVGWADLALSLAALVPMAIGLRLGRSLRGRLSETVFRRVLLAFLVAVALLLILK